MTVRTGSVVAVVRERDPPRVLPLAGCRGLSGWPRRAHRIVRAHIQRWNRMPAGTRTVRKGKGETEQREAGGLLFPALTLSPSHLT